MMKKKEREVEDNLKKTLKALIRADDNKFYYYAFVLSNSKYFSFIVNISIIANTVIQSFD
jgi:hypothetical protein